MMVQPARPPSAYSKTSKNRKSVIMSNPMVSNVSFNSDNSNSESSFDSMESAKRPNNKQIANATKELKQYKVEIVKQIGKGGYGVVYLAKYKKSSIVVKMSLYRRTESIIPRITEMKKLFQAQLELLSRQKRNKTLKKEKNEQQFFTEDYAFRSLEDDTVMFHIMEYLHGDDMFHFFKKNRKKITYDELMKIFCSFLHAVQFFHGAGILFNDMKLENVIVNNEKRRVSLIDYLDSSIGCKHLECSKPRDGSAIHTFEDIYNDKRSLAEDVWRIGITMLDALSILLNLTHQDYPANIIKDSITETEYPTEIIEDLVHSIVDSLKNRYSLEDNVSVGMKRMLVSMLHRDPQKRPSVSKILHTTPFDVCLKNKMFTLKKMLKSRRNDKKMVRRLRKKILSAKKKNILLNKRNLKKPSRKKMVGV